MWGRTFNTHERHKTKLSCGFFDAMRRQQNPHIALAMRGTCFLALRQKSSQTILRFMPFVSMKIGEQRDVSRIAEQELKHGVAFGRQYGFRRHVHVSGC
jgi:hypothetical protein